MGVLCSTRPKESKGNKANYGNFQRQSTIEALEYNSSLSSCESENAYYLKDFNRSSSEFVNQICMNWDLKDQVKS